MSTLRRCSRCAEALHRAEFLLRSLSAADLSFLRRTLPFSVAGLRRRPGAPHFSGEHLPGVSRSLRRIPEGVSCRLPGDEIEPVLEPGEFVVFLAHFERGFGLPASDFFRQILDFYRLQPHHLPGNAVFYLSCFVAFMEGYIGICPARETFARFFSLRINSVQGKDIPKPKPPIQCGSCIIGSRQGSPFFKFNGLESCRLWQTTFFYVKNNGAADLINLPAFNPAPPTKVNWGYFPGTDHIETNRVVRFMEKLMKETNICSDDIIRTFICRRVLPLKRRAHKISEMYGPGDPTKITGLPLSKADVVRKANQICQTDMPDDWEWGFLPLSSLNPPTNEAKDRFPRIESDRRGPCRKRPLDKVDPDPFVPWYDLKMGRIPTQRPGTTSAGRVAPTSPDHRAEEDLTSPPENQDTGASNTGADDEAAGRAEPLVPLAPKKKKKKHSSSSPSKAAPDTSAPASSTPPPEAPIIEPTGATPTPPLNQGPSAAKPPPPPETLKITKFLKPGASRGKSMEGSTSAAVITRFWLNHEVGRGQDGLGRLHVEDL
ncbi:hypothetical protein QYE76_046235 [Lolium multiflorum]|uniref:Transposase (putative) gypsy type domain-containing protein n=1 Tax=Lolium multiflorum TaxID=4521 RepID=A0AAD8TPH7_LOLMU|nr:hypothetical protein QYE76_046235 [Lolium multiflorum]